MSRISVALTVLTAGTVGVFVWRSLFGSNGNDFADVLLVVGYASGFLALFTFCLVLWKVHTYKRGRNLRALRPGAIVASSVRTPELVAALKAMDYQDELGAGLRPEDMSVSLDFVIDKFGFELWGGPVSSPRLYLRTPWRDVKSFQALRTVDVHPRHAGIAIETLRTNGLVRLPVQIVRGGASLGSERVETLNTIAEAAQSHIHRQPSPKSSRNSRAWLAVRDRLREWDVIRGRTSDMDWEYDDLATEVLEAWYGSSAADGAARVLVKAMRLDFGKTISMAEAKRVLGVSLPSEWRE
jgi:hypothetical protein